MFLRAILGGRKPRILDLAVRTTLSVGRNVARALSTRKPMSSGWRRP